MVKFLQLFLEVRELAQAGDLLAVRIDISCRRRRQMTLLTKLQTRACSLKIRIRAGRAALRDLGHRLTLGVMTRGRALRRRMNFGTTIRTSLRDACSAKAGLSIRIQPSLGTQRCLVRANNDLVKIGGQTRRLKLTVMMSLLSSMKSSSTSRNHTRDTLLEWTSKSKSYKLRIGPRRL